jgi:hypothetical protein
MRTIKYCAAMCVTRENDARDTREKGTCDDVRHYENSTSDNTRMTRDARDAREKLNRRHIYIKQILVENI